MVGGQPNGVGCILYEDGGSYAGEWLNGDTDGVGCTVESGQIRFHVLAPKVSAQLFFTGVVQVFELSILLPYSARKITSPG